MKMKWMILDVIEVCYRGIERPCALYAGTHFFKKDSISYLWDWYLNCLLYTSDAADDTPV